MLRVFNHIARDPGMASHASATEIAAEAGTSISAMTRAAQKAGYKGWGDFQRDLRSRYLAHLSLVEVSDAHQDASPFHASLMQDIDSLSVATNNIDEARINRVAKLIAQAANIYVTAQGSYAAVGQSLVHNIQLAGYPVRELLDKPASIANHLSRITSGDVLIVCSYWRLYDIAVIAAAEAKKRGATVIVLADNIAPVLESSADEIIIVPAEGRSFFPSMTPAVSVQQGLVAALAQLDPARTRASIVAAEEAWLQFKLLHRSVEKASSPPNAPGNPEALPATH